MSILQATNDTGTPAATPQGSSDGLYRSIDSLKSEYESAIAIDGIETIMTYGEDALANKFRVTFNLAQEILNILTRHNNLVTPFNNLSARVLTAVIPDQALGTYEITKGGRKLTRISGVTNQSRDVSITYRLDRELKLYKLNSLWLQLCQNTVNGAHLPENILRKCYGSIVSKNYLGQDTSLFGLAGLMPKSQSGITYDENSGEPLSATLTFDVVRIDYPIADLTTEL